VSLATLGLGESVVPFASLAAGMVAFQVVLLYLFLPREGIPTRPRLSRAILIGYLLPATAIMWAVLPGAVLRPSYDSWWAAIQAMMIPMPAPFLWFMTQVFQAEERPIDRRGLAWPMLLATAVIANEGLMGYAFAALAGAQGLDAPGTAFSLSVNSPWFAASMIATMIALILWVPAPTWHRWALGGVAATGLAGPLWLLDPLTCAFAMGAVMAATALVLVLGIAGAHPVDPASRRLVYAVGAALAVMTFAGVICTVLPAAGTDGAPLAITGLAVMFAETVYLLRRGLGAVPDPTPPFRLPVGDLVLTS
jgi:hypothetical protein